MMGGLDRRMMRRSTHILLSALFCGIAESYSPTRMLPSQIRLSARPLTRLGPARATLFSPNYAHRPARIIMASTAINTATRTNDLSGATNVERIAVVGGGPAGLSTAIMLARRGFKKIEVFDRLSEPDPAVWSDTERSYNIGIDKIGQRALAELGVWDEVDTNCADVHGRKDWVPEREEPSITILSEERGYVTKVIQRDRLTGCLLAHVRENYPQISVSHNCECTGVEWLERGARLALASTEPRAVSGGEVRAGGSTGSTVTLVGASENRDFDLVVGADGARSAVREALAESVAGCVSRAYQDDNERVYKTVTLNIAGTPEEQLDLNYSIRTKSDLVVDALPTREGLHVGVLLFRPTDHRVLSISTAKDARAFFAEHLPQLLPWIDDAALESFARKTVSRLPQFQYCGPVLHRGGEAALLGDAIHTVKPFFGFGVNQALEDVRVLGQCIDAATAGPSLVDTESALMRFSERRGAEAVSLVEISWGCDRPGPLGTVRFIGPIIVDKIFSKLFPSLFTPPILQLLRIDDDASFAEAQKRKRFERVGQIALVSTILALAGKTITAGAHVLSAVLATS